MAIGASAGGLEPTSQFLAASPADTGVAVVVIQHLDPSSKSMLAELLARRSTLAVSLAKDGTALHAAFVMNPVRRPMGLGLDLAGLAKEGTVIRLDIGLSPVSTAEGPLAVAAVHDLRQQEQSEELLREAKSAAERANQAKSRFLAAASHDLRQPLQTIELLHGVLERRLTDAESRATLTQLSGAVAHMTELLDSLLEVNRLESGEITPEIMEFSVAPVLARAYDEQAPIALAKGLQLRTVPCSSIVRSDRRMLARILGNLLTNAIKYTDHGKVLMGCRRRGGMLRIEVWDTGIGMPAGEQEAIFEEFYRVDAKDVSRSGLGLGLYTVQRFAQLLGHRVEVRSIPGMGTVFALLVAIGERDMTEAPPERPGAGELVQPTVLLVEDDRRQRDAFRALLEMDGYRVMTVATGDEALVKLQEPTSTRPDAVIADYNLPAGMTGLDTIHQVWRTTGRQLPALLVTADRSAAAQRAIEASGLMSLAKPVRTPELLAAIDSLVGLAKPGWQRGAPPTMPPALIAKEQPEATVAVIEDEPDVREAMRKVVESDGYRTATFSSADEFLGDAKRGRFRCLLVDLNLPGTDGLELLARLKQEGPRAPVIFVTGSGTLSLAVQAMREGAADFLQKPICAEALRTSVARVLSSGEQSTIALAQREEVAARLASLTQREREVMERVIAGQLTKNIAAELKISERTVEHHRHSVMRKMDATSLAMLVRTIAPHITEQ